MKINWELNNLVILRNSNYIIYMNMISQSATWSASTLSKRVEIVENVFLLILDNSFLHYISFA